MIAVQTSIFRSLINRSIATILLAGAFLLPHQLYAQPTSKHGPKVVRPIVSSDEKDAVRQHEKVMFAFVDCLVSRQKYRTLAFEFIALDPTGTAASDAGQKLTDPDCLPSVGRHQYVSRMSTTPLTLRYELVGALYRELFDGLPDTAITNLPAVNYNDEFSEGKIPDTLLGLREFGDCVARSTSQASHRLIFSDLYSDEEKAAIGQVMPKLQSCMPAGQDLGFSRAILRGAIAEGLLRLRQAFDAEKGDVE